MARVSGIKGINISKSSVLKDGTKKSKANDNTRDTSNGTTRDKSNDKAAIDSAMVKLILGHVELIAKKKAAEEQRMQINAKREEERYKKEEERAKRYEKAQLEREKREEERQRYKTDKRIDSVYDKIDSGIINSSLAGIFGPGAVMLGKALNKAGFDQVTRMGIKAGARGVGRLWSSTIGRRWGSDSTKGKKDKSESGDETQSAVSVNRREMAAEPTNRLRESVTKRLDMIIKLMGGKAPEKETEGKKSWLGKIWDSIKGAAAGLLSSLLPKLLPLILRGALIGALAYGFHKFWNWAKDKFGTDWANGLTAGLANAIKAPLKAIGHSLEKVGRGLKGLKQGFLKSKFWGATSKGLGKLAGAGKVGKFLFGGAAKRARAASIAAQKTLQSGALGATGKALKATGNALGKVGKVAGMVGSAVIVAENGIDAYQKYKAGDKRGAAESVGKGAGTLVGSAVGATAGKAIGAALGSFLGPVGTIAGAWLGGMAGSAIGGWVGSKAGGWVGKKSYDVATGTRPEDDQAPEVSSEGVYQTEDSTYAALEMQNQSLEMQNEILNTLRQIEYNLNPAVQEHLDQKYLNDAKTLFDTPPSVPQFDLGSMGFTPMDNNVLGRK